MSKHYRFTAFPTLHTLHGSPRILTAPIALPQGCTNDQIVASWAHLLRGYCGTDTVVFRVNGITSGVEFAEDGSMDWISEGSVENPSGGRWTGVFLNSEGFNPLDSQLYLTVDGGSAMAYINISTAVVPESYIHIICTHLHHLFTSTAHSVHTLSVLNPTPRHLPGPTLLHNLITFSTHDSLPALEFLHSNSSQSTYSYADLDILSTQFALKLLPHTTPTQRLIPVLLQQSPTLYIALIGILKAGCAFVPLPLEAPPQRLQFIVEDIKAPCIVCDPASPPVPNLPCVTPDEDTPTFSLASLMELPTTISPSDPAYVMYTSGTTGTPKGVLVSHYAAAQSLLAQDALVPKGVGRWLQQAAPTFDVFVFEMFFPLMRGIVLVGCERAVMLRDLPGVVRRMAVDVVELTPTVAGGLLGKREDIPGLKCLLTIGEMLTKGVVDMWRDVLVGMYGPTEAAIHCTASTAVERVGDIGTPFETVSAFVIAPYKGGEIEVLPVGCVGELVVGGPQLADGYINRPEQTQEVFINSTRFGRLYRTGDRARFLPSGAIECLGRIGAGQVKIRGLRIELGEIEEVVLKTPGVKACVANVIKNTLVIWVSGATSKLAIIETCKKWLPASMIPGDILILPTLPRLASGKADRKLLEANYKNRIVEPKAVTEDMNAFERVIAHEASLLLGAAPDKEVSLVSLGLDSMQAIRLAIALRKRGLEVETVDVIRSDTISGIAAGIEKGVGTPPRVMNEASQRRFEEVANASRELQEDQNVLKVIPCTSVQAAMLAETAKDSAAYCNWMLLSLPPNNNAAKVEAAVRKIIDANEILRTGFVVLEGGFAQVVYHTSRPAQFTLSNTIQKNWSVSVPQLLSPPFRAALVGGQLSVQIHHALYDGWCWDNIMSDLAAHLSGRSVAPRPQYQVVVEHELDTDNSSRIDYWRDALSGIEPVPFPCLTGKSDVVDEVRQETATMSTGKEEYESAARRFGVAPVVLIQAAWAMLWSLYVGENDVVVGNVLSGRTAALEGVENVIGPMIVTAPVRVNVRRQRSVREVISEVAKRGREVLGNEIGLREVTKAWGGEGRLFENLLIWQEPLTAEGSVKIVDLKDMLEFPILLEVTPNTVDISLRATYQTSILPPAHTALILAQLDQFVTSIISNPDQTLTDLLQSLPPSTLSIENLHIITPSITTTPSISHLVELAASRNPNAIAIDFADDIIGTTTESTTLTYHTFNTNANKLAYHLLSLGAKPETLISICMEKSPILYISILAILKSGAAYAHITPETPNERKNQIIESGDIRIHLTTSDLAPELSGVPQGVVVVCVDMVNTLWYSEENPDTQRSERDLAYAVFTSGSTGKPKGVLVENHAIVNHLRLLAEMYPAALGKRLLQFCTVAFDVSVFEIFFTWAMGMTLCVARKDVLLRDIESAINAFKITHLSMTPTVAALVNPDNVPSVEFLVTAGEGLNRKVFEAWTGRGLWAGYGPSEMVNICAVRPNLRKEDHINTLGETFSNTSTFVISQNEDEFCLLPRGAVGELCFGGAQVARGYLKQPELTAQKFPTHPTYGRVYRSGDIGRLLSDGSIEFIGRIDDQVKIRGHRIELGEITSILLRSAAVLHAAAIPVRKSSTDPYVLVAFVLLVSHQDKEFSVVKADQGVREILGVLFKALSASLPEYMVPAVLLPVTTIPMTATGKIDKTILEKIFFDVDTATVESYSEETGKEVDAQWSQVEMEIVGVVADVAQVTISEIGRGTSIFKLGLDSISVIQLSNRIMKAGYKRLDVSQIMKNPTVGALATLLGEKDEGQAATKIIREDSLKLFAESVKATAIEQLDVAPEDIMKILPCSPLQEAMLTQKKGVDASTYYNHTVLHLRADPARLKKAWELMAERHDIMRTCFCVTEDSRHAYAQVVLKKLGLPWTTFEVEATREQIDKRISEISGSMSINSAPYAFSLFAGATLVMSFHHSLYDGYAMGLLLDDVRSAYLGLELPIRRPFDRVLEYMENIDLEASDSFWKGLLTGFEASAFPDLTGKTALFKEETKLTGMTAARMTCSKTLNEIEEGCRETPTSLLALGQTGWARLLAAYSGETDVCFGSVVSGRTIPVDGVEDVIAPCFNTVPLRVQLTPGATNLTVMNSIRSLNADILPYQLTPLRRIMKTLKTEGQGLFDTLFILQYANGASEDLWEEVDDRGEMDFSVVVELVPNRNRNSLDIVLYFRRNIILEEQVDVIIQQLNAAIIDSLQYPDELAINFQRFKPSILARANGKPLKLEGEGYDLLHSEFERHARENPSHVALEFLDNDCKITSWTFRELNEAANRVAHYLVSLGLKRDEAVPLCLEKSPLFYICILGVLKAGCAFTPIDPTLPDQRKMFMVEELGARVVLVTAATAGGMGRVAMVDVESGVMDSQPVTNLNISGLTPRCLAYRLYTSGSTGQPKAVSLEIKSAVQTFRASKSLIPWKSDSRLLQFAATTFDMCYYDCFMAWSYGFTLCSAAKKHLLGDLEGTIMTMKATLLDLTPTVAATLVAENLTTVEMLYCIGEAMPQKVVNDWDGRCVNSYGPTEAAMCCTITATNRYTKSSNIGKPFPTASFFVLSRSGEYVVPIFGSGELCIGGPQVAREYHNNIQLTKRQFIQLERDTIYKTGDLVRMLGDGTFEFLGRADDQVKIRGLRVELDEISSVLRSRHRDIKDATTIVVKHSEGAKEQLVSFLAVEGRKQHGTKPKLLKASPLTEEIQSSALKAARTKLPRYMIPAVVLIIDHIPRSAAGKVDKKVLGAFFREQDIQSFGAAGVEEDESVWSEEEKKIRSVFSQISRVPVEQITRNSTIYEIGLDSISAAQVAMQLKRIDLEISVLDILERPSIKQLSKLLTTDSKHIEAKSQISDDYLVNFSDQFMDQILKDTGIAKDRIAGVFPCTPAQEGMLSQFLRSKGGLYFNHSVFKLPQNVDLSRLRKSWNAVSDSHDMLRAGFVEVEHNTHAFATIIYAQGSVDLPWTIVDIRENKDNVLSAQKELGASRALENLHLPPWSITVIRENAVESLLLFSAHHALYDAESLSLFLDDVFSEYSGKPVASRPKFSAVLSNIVKHSLDAEVIEEDKTFWLQQLKGTSISRFPNLCPVRVKSTSSHVCSTETSWSLSMIESRCRKLGISVNSVGQAAWARVLSAYMGDTAVTMGIVLSGRSGIIDAENVAFPCITTVPSLCLLTGTNLELALALQHSNAQTLKHQHTPLRNIQGWFEHRQESFFDSIFVYQKTGSSSKNLWEIVEEDAFVDYTISLEIEPTNDGSLLIRATCRDNVMPKEQTQLLIQQVNAALVDILQNPNSSSTEFLSFPPALLSCTPPLIDEIPTDITLLHKFVEKYRKLTPDKIAFEFATSIQEGCAIKETWTYTQLDEEGNRIANYLLKLGVKTGEIVAICFEKCPEASFAILGILKAGCAFMALDYNAPIDRKAFIVDDSGAKCVLTMDKYAKELKSKVKVRVVSLESDTEVKISSSETPFIADLKPEDLCYCLYTSGTTGTPKGCELTHENAVQAMLAFQRLFNGHWDSESRFLQFASFHFDVSVMEQYFSWSVGMCVTSAPRDVIFQDLTLTINELQITHLDLTPSLAALLRPEDCPSLCRGVFITGGEQLKQEILNNWGETGVIYNGYGPTEVTIGCTMYPRVPANGKPSNIGTAFDNVGSFVFTPNTSRPVLRGAIGELCVSGKLVGRGYLNRAALTEDKFPHLKEFNTRIYRTGDLVRILYDGTFDFAGRADDQVKLRGQRLEIGEINETLKQADSQVKAVATLVLRHPKQQKDQLVSFIVLGTVKASSTLDPVVLDDPEHHQVIPVLADGCRRKLPVYMVPTHFLPISRMPLSVNNKVDNKKLTEIYKDTSLALLQQISRREEVNEENWTDGEARIRKILAEMTGLQTLEIKHSSTVFELGLDSVSVVGLARKLKKDGFFASTVSLVMKYPGVKQLAAELSKGKNNSSQELARTGSINQKLTAFANKGSFEVCERLDLEMDQIEAIVPCTALQEGMILRFIDSEKPLYYNSFSFSLAKPTDTNLLHSAWDAVVKSTGILRTCFCETSDGYAQVVLRDSEVRWREINVKNENFQNVITDEMMEHVSMNRDLHQTPLYLLLLRTPSRIILVVNIFHALYDGNSLPLIFQDVQRAYRNQLKPRTHHFHELVGNILSIDMDGARKFWKFTLAEAKPSNFPQLTQSAADIDHIVQLKPKIVIEDVEKCCKKLNCTPQSIFQAAWANTLSPYLGHQSAFGVVVSGRSLPIDSVEDTIGPMFNTIPCFLDVKNASSWEKLIQQAHNFNSESITYHHTPLRLINKLMHATSEKPLFDTLFVYQRDPGSDDTTEAPIWNTMESSAVADYPLALEIEESYLHGLNFSIVAKSSVLTADKSLGLLSSLERNIKEILQSPLRKPSLEKTPESDLIISNESNDIHTNRQAGFQWGPDAKILRSTIAKLADIGESEVNEDSSIFELGLDSIEAIKLSSRLRSSSIKLSVSTIMRNPTIRKMHEVLSQSTKNSKSIPKADRLTEFEQSIRENLKGRKHTLDLDQIEAIYPATPLQEGMIAETLASDYKLYFNHDVLELDSAVDIRQLRNAWELVFQNSEILRTSFFKVSDISVDSPYSFGQAVHKRPELKWKEVLISSNTRNAIKAAMQKAVQNVDMLQGPPLQITIVKSPKTNYLVLSMSHVLYDGWSLGLLHEDVQNAYLDSPSSRPSCRPLLEDIFSMDAKDSNKFWKQMLAGSSPSMFQTSTVNSPAITHRFEKPSALPFWRIQSFCKQMGVTVQSLGQMCWALLLAHHLGEPDVLFGTVLSGRDIESADEMLFPAMNTVPVRAIAHGDYKDMLRYIQDNSARVLKYQHTPLRQIQKLVDSQGQRLFDTLFIYQRGREQSGSSQNPLWSSIDGAASVEYNICIEMEHYGDNLLWRNACKSTVLSETDSESLLQTLDSLLVHIVNNTDHPAMVHRKEGIAFGNIPICPRRSDSTTSLNGLRIDLDETANKIREAQSNTGDAAAIVASDNGRQLLVVFITEGQSVHKVASFARHEFPHWSMPSFIIPMSTLPHKDGKIDRSQLESHFRSMKPEECDEFAVQEKKGEWTPLELTFRRILSAVSQLPESEIERTQTIFHLGLDSISAISFSSKLREQSIFLSVAEILRAATIERMAAVAKTMNGEAPKTPVDMEGTLEKALGDINIKSLLGGIPEASIETVAPATAGQVYMLSAWKNSNYTIFMPTFTFRCRKIEHSRILSAWESLVRQESILRTTFLASDSEDTPLVQVTLRNPATQTESYQSSTTNNDNLINFLKSQEQSKPVDLEQPPVRFTTLTTPVDTIIFLTIHHALYDGVSLPLLLLKFQGFLDDSVERLPTPEPDAPRFLDFVSFTHSQDVQQQSRFWSKYLDGAVSTLVPLKYPDLQTTERTELFRTGVIDKRNLLESRCRAEGISLQSVFLAAYAKVYAYHLDLKDGPVKKREDVIFGIYLSNRHLPISDLALMAAPTLNLVPLRIRSPRTTTLVQLARQVQADLTEIGSAGNGTVGLWQVEKWTGVQVDCFFNYLKMPGGDEGPDTDGGMGFEDLKVDVKSSNLGAARAELPEKTWMDSAKTHLDIEVAVHGDKVDIGVFSIAQTLNREDANNTIEWMRDIVMGIL